MLKAQRGFTVLFVLIIVALIAVFSIGGFFYIQNHKSNLTDKSELISLSNKPIPQQDTNSVEDTDLYKKGLYINPRVNVAFNFPPEWSLSDKSTSKDGTVSMTWQLKDMTGKKWYEVEYVSIEIEKGYSQRLNHYVALLKKDNKGKFEQKTIGTLTGDYYSEETLKEPQRYKEEFIVTYENVSFKFSLNLNSPDKELGTSFQNLISSVKGYEKTSYKLPAYLEDNLVIDSKISKPSYITPGFSLIVDKQTENEIEWWHSLYVTETNSGPNDLNIYINRLGSEAHNGNSVYIMNLENALKEITGSESTGYIKDRVQVEYVMIKNYKGYHILKKSFQDSKEESYGNLIFETDKAVVNIKAGTHADASKAELLKIAESMIH